MVQTQRGGQTRNLLITSRMHIQLSHQGHTQHAKCYTQHAKCYTQHAKCYTQHAKC